MISPTQSMLRGGRSGGGGGSSPAASPASSSPHVYQEGGGYHCGASSTSTSPPPQRRAIVNGLNHNGPAYRASTPPSVRTNLLSPPANPPHPPPQQQHHNSYTASYTSGPVDVDAVSPGTASSGNSSSGERSPTGRPTGGGGRGRLLRREPSDGDGSTQEEEEVLTPPYPIDQLSPTTKRNVARGEHGGVQFLPAFDESNTAAAACGGVALTGAGDISEKGSRGRKSPLGGLGGGMIGDGIGGIGGGSSHAGSSNSGSGSGVSGGGLGTFRSRFASGGPSSLLSSGGAHRDRDRDRSHGGDAAGAPARAPPPGASWDSILGDDDGTGGGTGTGTGGGIGKNQRRRSRSRGRFDRLLSRPSAATAFLDDSAMADEEKKEQRGGNAHWNGKGGNGNEAGGGVGITTATTRTPVVSNGDRHRQQYKPRQQQERAQQDKQPDEARDYYDVARGNLHHDETEDDDDEAQDATVSSVTALSDRSSILTRASSTGRSGRGIGGSGGGSTIGKGGLFRSRLRHGKGGGGGTTANAAADEGEEGGISLSTSSVASLSSDRDNGFTSVGEAAVGGGDGRGGGGGGKGGALSSVAGTSGSDRNTTGSSVSHQYRKITGGSTAGEGGQSLLGRKVGGGKVSRLAQLFSSRAVVKGGGGGGSGGGGGCGGSQSTPAREAVPKEAPASAAAAAVPMTMTSPSEDSRRPFEDPLGSFRHQIEGATPNSSNAVRRHGHRIGSEDDDASLPSSTLDGGDANAHTAVLSSSASARGSSVPSSQSKPGHPAHHQVSYSTSASTTAVPFVRRRPANQPQPQLSVPPSPSHSAATSGASRASSAVYVGWPGTQDRYGGTVAIKPSFSESEGGISGGGGSGSGGILNVSAANNPAEEAKAEAVAEAEATKAHQRSRSQSQPGEWIDAEDVVGDYDSESDYSKDADDNGSGRQRRDGLVGGRFDVSGGGGAGSGRTQQQRLAQEQRMDEGSDDDEAEEGDGDIIDDQNFGGLGGNPADFHLAAAIADARAAEKSPVRALRPSPIDAPPYHAHLNRNRSIASASSNGSSYVSAAAAAPSSAGSKQNHQQQQQQHRSRFLSPHSASAKSQPTTPLSVAGLSVTTPVSVGPSPLPSPGPSPTSGIESHVHMLAPLASPSSDGAPTPGATPGRAEGNSGSSFDWQLKSGGSSGSGMLVQNLSDANGIPTPRSSQRVAATAATPSPRSHFFGGGASSRLTDTIDEEEARGSPTVSSPTSSRSFHRDGPSSGGGGGSQTTSPPSPDPPATATALGAAGGGVPAGIDISGSASRVLASGRSPISSPARRQASPRNHQNDEDGGGFAVAAAAAASTLSPHGHSSPKRVAPPTEAALREQERIMSSPPSGSQRLAHVNPRNVRGYRGFIDKTRDVPNLMDAEEDESVAETSVSTARPGSSSAYKNSSDVVGGSQQSRQTVVEGGNQRTDSCRSSRSGSAVDSGSDVFAGLSDVGEGSNPNSSVDLRQQQQQQQQQQQKRGLKGSTLMDIVRLRNGALATMQSSPPEVRQDGLGVDADGHDDSETSRARRAAPMAPRPPSGGVNPNPMAVSTATAMVLATLPGDKYEYSEDEDGTFDSQGSSLYDLSLYYVPPDQVRKLVRKYRKMCSLYGSRPDANAEVEEDAKKAFALFEMRSRIMETDIDRGLERTGGTVPVDDVVTTSYGQAAHRIRDAVVVSKAWRDGATPRDVITAFLLTQRAGRTYYVARPIAGHNDFSEGYTFEEVRWMDDTDFMQLRCPSLGPRCMRGFEMFTIGDCQSVLLKLTNERCTQLRRELNDAIARQLEAEEIMKEEGDDDADGFFDDSGMMTDSEMAYLEAMEEVKGISKKLVVSEKAFQLVRERIEALIAKYEDFLVKINNDDASVVSFGASSYTQSDYSSRYTYDKEREKEALALRAQRAEILAEMAAREAHLTKQAAEQMRAEKQRELDALHDKLMELETTSAYIESDFDRTASSYGSNGSASPYGRTQVQSAHNQGSGLGADKAKVEARERIKAKFRSRRAERLRQDPFRSEVGSNAALSFNRNKMIAGGDNLRLAGEEMYQHLDFYERSLKAVAKRTSDR